MKQKQFENIWAKNNKMKCRLQDWVRVRGLEPTYDICRDYWMGKIKSYLNPYTGNVEHLNTRIEGNQILVELDILIMITMENRNEFRDRIDRRTEDLGSNWWPFTENIKDVLNRMDEIEQIVIDLENRIGEAYGLSKSICKSLNKLGFYDKEHKLIWANVKKMEEVLKDEEQMDGNGKKEDG